MGCDIHIYAEKKENGKWVKIGKEFPNPYYNRDKESKVDDDGYEWNAQFIDQPYTGRNYDLFAILADVRNGRGFAGIRTGAGFIPICDPKGLPKDVSKEINQLSDEWGSDGHSHSWFTVSELLAYDWNQLTTNYGVINVDQYKIFKESGEFEGYYCGSVSGTKTRTLTNSEMDKLISTNAFEKNIEYYTQVEWGTTYRAAVGERFMDETIPSLLKFGDADNVRIVFWFDN